MPDQALSVRHHDAPRYRGRFAPSPTGPLHFGSVVAAVASYAAARSHGGEWAIRIDDLDRPRAVPGAADDILRMLEALGMTWDGRVVFQSTRGAAYHAAFHRLRRSGLVYPCRCSRKEIADSSIRGIEGYVYPGSCRSGLAGRARAWRIDARAPAIAFDDAVQGPQHQDVATAVGDFVLYRSDGQYAYHLACAVDDAEQGITHVVRGADLLVSTPRQILVQRALGLATPRYAHVPVAVNADGQKLSKQTLAAAVTRDAASDTLIAAFDFLGQDVDAAGMCGLDCATLWRELLPRWRFDRIPRTSTRPAPA